MKREKGEKGVFDSLPTKEFYSFLNFTPVVKLEDLKLGIFLKDHLASCTIVLVWLLFGSC